MKPRCYNRPPYMGHWAPNGYRKGKRVLRFIRHRMSNDCGAWKAGDGQPSIPESEAWNCSGCRWKPEVEHE